MLAFQKTIFSLFRLVCLDLFIGKIYFSPKKLKKNLDIVFISWNLLDELNPSNGLKNPEHQENTIYNCIQFDHNCNTKNPDYFVGASNDKYVRTFLQIILFSFFHSSASSKTGVTI